MEFLRRLTLLIYGLALLALVAVVLLAPDTVADGLRRLGEVTPSIRGAIAVVVGLIIVLALYWMVRAPRRENKDGLIVKTPGALADVSVSSARDLILKAVLAVPNVVSADMRLQAPEGKADIDLAVEVAGTNINVPEKQKEIDRALRQVTLKQLGLQLASRPRVHIQLITDDEVRARDEAARQAILPPPPAPLVEPQTPPPPPPETPSVTSLPYVSPVAAMVQEPPPEPVAPPAPTPIEDEPLPIEVHPTPVWDEPILPPEGLDETPEPAPEPEQDTDVSDFESMVEVDDDEPEWLRALTQSTVIVEETNVADASAAPVDAPDADVQGEDDDVISLASEAAPSDVQVVDVGGDDDGLVPPEEGSSDDWLNFDSSESAESGLYAEDDDSTRRAADNVPSPDRE